MFCSKNTEQEHTHTHTQLHGGGGGQGMIWLNLEDKGQSSNLTIFVF